MRDSGRLRAGRVIRTTRAPCPQLDAERASGRPGGTQDGSRREIEDIMFYRDERLALFIDGPNNHAATKALGFDIDYKLLRSEFMRRGKMVRAFYYTARYCQRKLA